MNKIIGIYIAITIMFAGIGIGSEMGMKRPDYKFIISFALLWPFFLLFGLYITTVK